VSFTAPTDTGGAAITGYTVTSSPGGITATGSSSPITVTGLTNGTAYTFTVTATNSAGTGTASSASSSVAPANTAPVNNVPGAQTVNEDTALTFTGSQAISVSDAEGNLVATYLTVAQGTLTVPFAGGAMISGDNGSAALTILGTQSQINERDFGLQKRKLDFAYSAIGSASTPEAAIAEVTKGAKDGVFAVGAQVFDQLAISGQRRIENVAVGGTDAERAKIPATVADRATYGTCYIPRAEKVGISGSRQVEGARAHRRVESLRGGNDTTRGAGLQIVPTESL
jgi:hypothetical protein